MMTETRLVMTNRNELTAPNSEPKGRILVVDDEIELTNALVEMLNKQNYQAIGFTDGNKALERLKQESFDILLADLMMPAIDGITLLKSALQIDPNIVGLIMTGQGTVQTAVDAMKSGAFDYILKPFKLNAVLITLAKSLEVRRLRMENITLRETVSIYELGQLVSSTLDSRAIAHKTAEAVRQQSDADEVSILVPVTGGEEMVVVAASGGDREFLVDQRVPKANTIAGWVANNQEMLTLEGEVMDERFSPAYPRPEIIRAISLPMVLNKNLIGVMNVNITNKPRNLSEGQIRGLQTLANIAASALENARLYQETEERLRRLDALRRIDLAISSSMDIRISLDVLLDQVHTHLKVDASSVLLMDPASNDFYAAATRGFRSLAASRMRVRMGSGCVGRAAVERRTVPASDPDELKEDPLLTQLPVDEEIQFIAATPLISKGAVEGVLVVLQRSPFTPSEDWYSFLEILAGQAAIAINNARLFENLQITNQQLIMAYSETIEGWSRALDLRDQETEGHTQRVTEMSLRLARSMNVFSDEELTYFRWGALLHDIGKMGVPDQILLKPEKLTEKEEAIMRMHPEFAFRLLNSITFLRRALDIPHYHHEWYDGTGYPEGLKGEQIPLAARIFAIVDVWDALCSDRPYREGWSDDKVIRYLKKQTGTQFDPKVVDAFLKVLEETPERE